MNITLSPVRSDTRLDLARKGDVLIVNGKRFDFSFVHDGDLLPAGAVEGEWLRSDVTRVDGVLHLTVALPHGPDAPEETRFPVPPSVVTDGPIDLPPYGAPTNDTPEVSE